MTEQVVHIALNEEQFNALAWLADRYSSADFLWQHTQIAVSYSYDQPAIWTTELTPEECVEYLRLLQEENNDPGQTVPPCAGGELREKLEVAYVQALEWAEHA